MLITKVVPRDDFKVIIYYENRVIKLFDASVLLKAYPILKDKAFFNDRCTMMNDILAWDISGTMDDTVCIDIAPEVLEGTISVEFEESR